MNHNRQRQFVSSASLGTILRCGWLVGLISVTCIFASQDLHAQIDGGGIGGGDFGGNTGGDFGGNTGGDFGGNAGGDGGFGDDFGNVLGGDTGDQRNQGFVGVAGTRITESGFVGPPGETTGPPLSDGATFGGGSNNIGGTNGGGGGGNRANTGFGGANLQGGIVKGFEVPRRSVRSILRPSFSSPQIAGEQVASRFQNRITRQPDMGADGASVQISVRNQTATMQGFVQSSEEMDRIERQLRLEPGVYRIENRVQVIGQ